MKKYREKSYLIRLTVIVIGLHFLYHRIKVLNLRLQFFNVLCDGG